VKKNKIELLIFIIIIITIIIQRTACAVQIATNYKQ